MYLAVSATRENTYTAHADKETGEVVLLSREGEPPDTSVEVVLEERFKVTEAIDLKRALQLAIDDANEINSAKAVLDRH